MFTIKQGSLRLTARVNHAEPLGIMSLGARRKVTRKMKGKLKIPVDKRIMKELAAWGIDKKALGSILFTILITAILHQLGVQFSLPAGDESSEEEVRIEEILAELEADKNLDKITKRIPKKTLVEALKAIVRRDGDSILQTYDADDIPAGYPALPRDLEEFLLRHSKG